MPLRAPHIEKGRVPGIFRWLVGFIEITAGMVGIKLLLGLLSAVKETASRTDTNLMTWWSLVIGLLLALAYIASCVAGLAIISRRSRSVEFSVAIQMLQIPFFSVMGFTYSIALGLGLWLKFYPTIAFAVQYGGGATIKFGDSVGVLGMNLFPLGVLAILFTIRELEGL